MPFRIDLHNHTIYSPDSSLAPQETLDRAIELGLDGVAFTEHNTYIDATLIEDLRRKFEGRIKVFRGAEYSAAEGHVLLFGIREDFFKDVGPGLPITGILKKVNAQGGVAVIPHPFRQWSLLRSDIGGLKGVCAIEAYNGHNNEDENRLALEAATALKLPTTGGSDSHAIHEIGSCYTEFMDEVTYDNFLEALKKGRYRGLPAHGPLLK